MRAITKEAVNAFEGGYNMTKSNTSVVDGVLALHGNAIAKLIDGRLMVTLAGWNTPTTRERLSGLTGVSASTRQGQASINGFNVPDDEWIEIDL